MKKIQILGTGCAKCNQLVANAEEAAGSLGKEVVIEKVTDLKEFVTYGCMSTPGVVVDGVLVSQGKLLRTEQIRNLLKDE